MLYRNFQICLGIHLCHLIAPNPATSSTRVLENPTFRAIGLPCSVS